MLTKGEIYLRFSEGPVTLQEGLEIIRSYIYLRKGKEISIIPPRNLGEATLFQLFLEVIKKWSA